MKRLLAFAVLAVSLSGCAALFNSRQKGIMFTSEPSGSEVLLDGQSYGRTPLSIKLRQRTTYAVTFRQSGYDDRTYRLNNHVGAGWIVLDVLGGIIPVVIDAATGSWYSLDDNAVHGVLPASRIPAARDSVDAGAASQPQEQAKAVTSRESIPASPILRGVPFTIALQDGSVLPAAAIAPSGTDMLKVTRADGKVEYIASYKVRSIFGEDGTDWTRRVINDRAILPRH